MTFTFTQFHGGYPQILRGGQANHKRIVAAPDERRDRRNRLPFRLRKINENFGAKSLQQKELPECVYRAAAPHTSVNAMNAMNETRRGRDLSVLECRVFGPRLRDSFTHRDAYPETKIGLANSRGPSP
jgi:hypothetical protein